MKGQKLHFFTDRPALIFYELLVSRLPNQKQTACVACPGIWLLIQQLDYAGAPLET